MYNLAKIIDQKIESKSTKGTSGPNLTQINHNITVNSTLVYDATSSIHSSSLNDDFLLNSNRSVNSTMLLGSAISRASSVGYRYEASSEYQDDFTFLMQKEATSGRYTTVSSAASTIHVNKVYESKKVSCFTPRTQSLWARPNIFKSILNPDYGTKFEYLINLFDNVINIKESNETKTCKINANISPVLDEKKLIYSKLQEYLDVVAQNEMKTYNCETTVLYVQHIGFLLGIVYSEKLLSEIDLSFNDISMDEDSEENISQNERKFELLKARFETYYELEQQFKSDKTYYYKNETVKSLDAQYGDLASDINNTEAEIIDALQIEFVKYSHYFAAMNELCAEMDCLQAFAMVAKQSNFVKPNLMLEKTETNHSQ